MSDNVNASNRVCGHCIECCQGWMLLDVNGVEVSPGSPCAHSTKKGCGIYLTRPEVCSNLKCGWLLNDKIFPVWMRPDKSKVIVVLRDFEGVAVFVAFSAGGEPTAKVVSFLKSLSNEQRMPLLLYGWCKENGKYTKQLSYTAYAPPGMEEVLERMVASINQNGVM